MIVLKFPCCLIYCLYCNLKIFHFGRMLWYCKSLIKIFHFGRVLWSWEKKCCCCLLVAGFTPCWICGFLRHVSITVSHILAGACTCPCLR